MENLDTFLARHPPFQAIATEQLRALVAGAVEREFAAGTAVLVEDGAPARGLWVILTGSMDLVHQGEVIEVLEPGECFGHPSLLTGMSPAFTVRAREPSTCALFAPEAGRRLLGTEAGAAYIAETMRQRLIGAGHTVHGLHDVGTTPVSAIMRPASFCEPDAPVREAVTRLGEAGISALLVRLDDDELAIVTDAEVRARVAGDGVGADAPLRMIARAPVPTVPIGQLAIEATVDMLAAGVEHMAVLDGGRVCGILSAADLLGLDASGPIGLRHTILGAADEEVLVRAVSHLPQLFLALARAWSTSRSPSTGRRRCRGRGLIWAAPRGGSSRSPPTRTTRSPTATRRGARRTRSMPSLSGSDPTSTRAWPDAGSAWTTTACSPATGGGGCPRRIGYAHSMSAWRSPTSPTWSAPRSRLTSGRRPAGWPSRPSSPRGSGRRASTLS
jgi:CBS domain-containing protein